MIVAEGADFGGRRITRTDLATGRTWILSARFRGRPYNSCNDIAIDEKGRIYFSDPRYLGDEPVDQPVMAVYRLDPDGTVARIITDAGKPNGVAISPDQKTFYLVSNDNGATGFDLLDPTETSRKGHMALMAYDLAPDGTAKFRKTLVDYSPEDGPDGLTVDTDGNVYAAVRDVTRPGICCYSPEGKELAYIPTEVPTNVGFGRGTENALHHGREESLPDPLEQRRIRATGALVESAVLRKSASPRRTRTRLRHLGWSGTDRKLPARP